MADELVTVASTFWDFGSLYLKTLRRPLCQLLWQRQSVPPRGSELPDESFTVLCIVTDASAFWDFGWFNQGRCGVM